jgi:fumarylacetoacetase
LRHSDPYTFDIKLEVSLNINELPDKETTVCKTNFKNMYWSMKQQLTHHTVSGCNVRPGDLLASGTISGDSRESFGSMLEISWRGQQPFFFDEEKSIKRVFIADGDTVTMKGRIN